LSPCTTRDFFFKEIPFKTAHFTWEFCFGTRDKTKIRELRLRLVQEEEERIWRVEEARVRLEEEEEVREQAKKIPM
jgi:hypothetical protein